MDIKKVKEFAKTIKLPKPKQDNNWAHYFVAAGAVMKDGAEFFANNRTDLFDNEIGMCAERQIIAKIISSGLNPADISKMVVWASDIGYEEINLSCCGDCRHALQKYCPNTIIEMRYRNKIENVEVKDLTKFINYFIIIYDGAPMNPDYKGKILGSHNDFINFQTLSIEEQIQIRSESDSKLQIEIDRLTKEEAANIKRR